MPDSLEAARGELRSAIRELGRSRAGARAQAALRALEVDLTRWLEAECTTGPGFEPRLLEWSFGGEGDQHGTLDLGPIRVSGRVDRVDVGPHGEALVRDYKNSKGYPQKTWAEDGHLQAALYALAVRDVLGLHPAGAVYQPLRGKDLRPRGAAVAGEAAAGLVDNDVVEPAEWERLLDTLAGEAGDAARRMRAGEIKACPERCSPVGCAYPGICRAGEAPPGAR
jgi:RecB family exonuclease